MRTDNFGQQIFTADDLFHQYMMNPDGKFQRVLLEHSETFDPELELERVPEITVYQEPTDGLATWDSKKQQTWHMPAEYKNMDIAAWVLDQCQTDEQRQRVGQELLLYLERDLFDLLKYLKYLVDTMRVNNIVWGVGRGSSVASYVLYLVGVHRIDSMFYDLDIKEFLR